MARPSNKYVTYTREFDNGKIGVFYAPAQPFMVNGSVNGGAIKFADLKIKRQTPSGKLIGRGIDFTVRVLGTGSMSEARALKDSIVDLLSHKIASTKILNAA